MLRKRSYALCIALLSLAACGDSATEAEQAHIGRYSLVTVNDTTLPFTLDREGTARLDVTAGSIVVSSSGSFTDITQYLLTDGTASQTQSQTFSGKYKVSGTMLTMTPTQGDVYDMQFSAGNTLTQIVGPFTFVYRK
jgi:hypothetical protein